MRNETFFSKLIKENRKMLLAYYKPARLTMWALGQRHPRYDEALKLAKILDVDVNRIPWTRVQVNK